LISERENTFSPDFTSAEYNEREEKLCARDAQQQAKRKNQAGRQEGNAEI